MEGVQFTFDEAKRLNQVSNVNYNPGQKDRASAVIVGVFGEYARGGRNTDRMTNRAQLGSGDSTCMIRRGCEVGSLAVEPDAINSL